MFEVIQKAMRHEFAALLGNMLSSMLLDTFCAQLAMLKARVNVGPVNVGPPFSRRGYHQPLVGEACVDSHIQFEDSWLVAF